ncbi:WD40/YVTN/BNR-like repeat-containing protein [Haloferax sp. DFSO52]|uniref:WD40/YVTN/BNR-like repeat-containing protein n=1 Tax=Haloferax sp. DFSO52 TaxID=3388505 RepID=UPI003A856AA7
MHLYAAADGAVLSVSGPLDDLRTRRRLGDSRIECVAADDRVPERAFCGTFDSGLLRTTDGGDTWEPVGADTLPESITSLAISPADPDTIYAGTEPSAVFRSTDGGATWGELTGLTALPSSSRWAFPPRPHTHHVRWIEVDPSDPARLFVAVEAGALVRSLDGGETWQDRVPTSKRDTHSMATHPDRPGHVWGAAGDGYAESDDGGETWTTPTDGLGHGYCWSVAVDRADPQSVLLTAARSPMRAHNVGSAESYLYRTRGESAWERLDDTGLPTGGGATRAVLATGLAGGECYAVNDHGLYRTTDFGDSWTLLDVPWTDTRRTAAGLTVVG